MTVQDMDRSVSFYSNVLAFEKVSDSKSATDNKGAYTRIVRLKLGDEMIELTAYHPSKGRPIPADMKSNDVYFQHIAIVVSDMDKAYAILKKNMASQISKMPETIPLSNPAAAGIRAFYFHDPDHHDLELIYFPQGKGQPKWQNTNGKLFLGIDHTAIGITSTEKSLNFYKNLLGFDRKGDSWNKGMEQMDLSNVKGASLHITGLRAEGGPGVEFLQYLVPGPGKPFPKDTKVNDIWYWQITVVTDQLGNLYKKLEEAHCHFIKRLIVGDKEAKYFIVQDPDGHALKITE
jgi:catechol 2,3-dioxygenase-like lactoylglutathione lyase family enzyme